MAAVTRTTNHHEPIKESSVTSSTSSRLSSYFKAVSVAVILIAVAVIITVLVPSNSTSGSTLQSQVSITSNGFTPATLWIKPGTTVTWNNEDQLAHQVAADPYPVDSSITGLDSGIVMQQNDSYSFTFNQRGTYTYHDDMHPFQMQGVVVVK